MSATESAPSTRIEAVAPSIAADLLALVPERHDWVPARPSTQPKADWRSLDRLRPRLEALGLEYDADVELTSVKIARRMKRTPVLRCYLGDGGTISCGQYRIALRVWPWLALDVFRRKGYSGDVVECETELDDGTLVATSNATQAGVWAQPAWVHAEHLPRRAAPADVVGRHRRRIAEHVDAQPGRRAVTFGSTAEVLRAQAARLKRRRRYRETLGWVTRDELAVLSGWDGDRLDELEVAVRAQLAVATGTAP